MKRILLIIGSSRKLSDRSFLRKINQEKKTLKKEEIVSDDVEVANTLNTFFSTIVKNLKIPQKVAENNLPHSSLRPPFRAKTTQTWCHCKIFSTFYKFLFFTS